MSRWKINAEIGNCALCDGLCGKGDVIHAMLEDNDKRLLVTEVISIRHPRNDPIQVKATCEQLGRNDPLEITIPLARPLYFRMRKVRSYPTFCFHDLCWAIFMQTLDHPPLRACYDITLAILKREHKAHYCRTGPRTPVEFYKPQTIERGYQIYLSQFSRRRLPSSSDQDCPDILLSLRHLPYELRVHIWGYLDSSDHVARALVILFRLRNLIGLEDGHSQGPISKIHLGDLELFFYSFFTGSAWLQCIHVEPLGIATCRGKIAISTPIRTVELINKCSAIRFYTGEGKTDWLGKVPLRPEDRWYRFIYNKENSGLLYLEGRDRIENVGFENKNDMVLSSKGKKSDMPFGSGFEWQPPLTLIEVYPEESYFNHQSFAMWTSVYYGTQVRRVRFRRDGYRLDRITMFLHRGIAGFECVFQKNDDPDVYETQFTGKRTPDTSHLQLGQGEVITHVWIARETEFWAGIQECFGPGPLGLYLGTSFGRVKSFNNTEYRDIHSLTRQEHGVVTGIYWDTSCSYGVTFSGQPQRYPHIPDPDPDIVSWKDTAAVIT